ncbi:hypothetical protein PVAG01_02178 [Phlyctema vagabunda]|uniref:Uncharacterized protein n=1 Tax=Phlyctema vagabunda TaxID=108571 RepID=A0ABR4PPV3_9HELO
MPKNEETQPTDLTLLFKHGRQTVLLLSKPLTPFPTIISELLDTLRERYPDGMPTSGSDHTMTIPDSVHDVIIGIPKDAFEPSKGWAELTTGAEDNTETPKSLGLKEGSLLAFNFVEEGAKSKPVDFPVEWSSYEEQYGTAEPIDEDEDDEE